MSRRPEPPPSAYDSGTWDHAARVCPPPAILGARLDAELDPVRRRAVEDHLDACADCAAEARRLESLAGLLRAWDAEKREVVPPSRLLDQVVREVASDAGARRTAARRHAVRATLAAAAVVLVVGAAAWAGFAHGRRAGEAPVVATGTVASRATAARDDDAGVHLRAPSVVDAFVGLPSPALETAVARLAPTTTARDLVFDDPVAREAMARYALLRDVQDRLGEMVMVVDGRALGESAAGAFQGAVRRDRWIRDRLARAGEPPTRDPADVGTALARAATLPSAPAEVAAFLGSLRRASVAAAPGTGGVRLHGLPARDPANPETARAIDLAEAVRTGAIRLLEDAAPDPEVVVAYVTALDAPVLVPAGELLRGGIAPRVVAHGVWIGPGSSAGPGASFPVRLPCRAIGRVTRGAARGSPEPVGAVAGPDLRAALVRGAGADAVNSLVRAHLRDAGVGEREADERGLLAIYDDAGRAARDSTARALVADLTAGDDDLRHGFLATDPDGRYQGLESVAVPGAAGRAWLARLAAGYLAEARTRSSADAPRFGARAEQVLSMLASRPVRLVPPHGARSSALLSGDEPRTGAVFESVTTEDGAVVLTSGLLPDVR